MNHPLGTHLGGKVAIVSGSGTRNDCGAVRICARLMALEPVIDAAWTRIARAGVSGRTLTLKAKFADFKLVARSRTVTVPLSDRSQIAETGSALLRSLLPVEQGIRLLGLTLSGLGGDVAISDETQSPLNFDLDAGRLQPTGKWSTASKELRIAP